MYCRLLLQCIAAYYGTIFTSTILRNSRASCKGVLHWRKLTGVVLRAARYIMQQAMYLPWPWLRVVTCLTVFRTQNHPKSTTSKLLQLS